MPPGGWPALAALVPGGPSLTEPKLSSNVQTEAPRLPLLAGRRGAGALRFGGPFLGSPSRLSGIRLIDFVAGTGPGQSGVRAPLARAEDHEHAPACRAPLRASVAGCAGQHGREHRSPAPFGLTVWPGPLARNCAAQSITPRWGCRKPPPGLRGGAQGASGAYGAATGLAGRPSRFSGAAGGQRGTDAKHGAHARQERLGVAEQPGGQPRVGCPAPLVRCAHLGGQRLTQVGANLALRYPP